MHLPEAGLQHARLYKLYTDSMPFPKGADGKAYNDPGGPGNAGCPPQGAGR